MKICSNFFVLFFLLLNALKVKGSSSYDAGEEECSLLCDCVGLADCPCCPSTLRQNGEPCSPEYPCDHESNLACYYKPSIGANSSRSVSGIAHLSAEEAFYPPVPKTAEELNRETNNYLRSQRRFMQQKVISLTVKPPNSNSFGTCWKKHGRPCFINSKVVEHTSLDRQSCRYSCVCVDGQMMCADLCLQTEQRPVSSVLCQPAYDMLRGSLRRTSATLLPSTNAKQCCKQWACLPQPTPPLFSDISSEKAHCDASKIGKTSKWSACSRQCDVGVSIRTKIVGPHCRNITQVRLCFWRPCKDEDKQITQPSQGENICTPTVKSKTPGHIQFALDNCRKDSPLYGKDKCVTCRTTRTYRPKFCTSCYENSCCLPSRVRLKKLTFLCSNGSKIQHYFEWIQSCKCLPQTCPKTWNGGGYY